MTCMHTSICKDIAHSCTNLTMSPLMMWRHSSPRTMPASNIPLQKSIQPTLPNEPSESGKTILLPCKQVQLNLTASPTEQTDISPCTQNPNLSVHEALEGMFSFDATPIAPIGTKCMIHMKPAYCHTWGYHAIKVWYFPPALNHY
ncbi:hypothetical protein ACHAW6_011922 [Cyclotella cf. meneghiniana]